MRSHDLNRLLDKPGCKHQLSGNIFCDSTARERRWDHPSRQHRWIRPSLQRSRAKARIFWAQAQRISQCVARAHPQQPQRHWRKDGVGGLCAQIDFRLGHRRLGNGWQYPSPHDHHGCATASAQQLRPWCWRGGRAQRLFEHQQLQQRNHALAVGMQKAKVAQTRTHGKSAGSVKPS